MAGRFELENFQALCQLPQNMDLGIHNELLSHSLICSINTAWVLTDGQRGSVAVCNHSEGLHPENPQDSPQLPFPVKEARVSGREVGLPELHPSEGRWGSCSSRDDFSRERAAIEQMSKALARSVYYHTLIILSNVLWDKPKGNMRAITRAHMNNKLIITFFGTSLSLRWISQTALD